METTQADARWEESLESEARHQVTWEPQRCGTVLVSNWAQSGGERTEGGARQAIAHRSRKSVNASRGNMKKTASYTS